MKAGDEVRVDGKAGIVDRVKSPRAIPHPRMVFPRRYLVLFDDDTAGWFAEDRVSPQATLEAFPGRKA